MLILLNILEYSGMKNVIGILSHIKYPRKEQTRLNIGKWLKQQNKHFLTIKFQKSCRPTRNYRI